MGYAMTQKEHSDYGGSVADKWLNCAGYVSAVTDIPPSPDNANTVSGTAQHMLIEQIAKTGRSPEAWLGKPWLTKNPGFSGTYDEGNAERARVWFDAIYALCDPLDYAIAIEAKIALTSISPELYGSCDLSAVDTIGKHLIVIDYKDGGGLIVDVKTTPQVRFYAVGVDDTRNLGVDSSWRVTYAIVQPKALDAVTLFETTGADLIEWRGIFRYAYKKSKGPDAKLTPGSWCHWCRHEGCPARATDKKLELRREFGGPIQPRDLAPEQIANVIRMAPDVRDWLQSVESIALTKAQAGQDIPGFKVVASRGGNRQWGDTLAAEEAMVAQIGDAAYSVVRKLISPTHAERKMGPKGYEAVAGFVIRAPGGPTLCPEASDRPLYDRQAEARQAFFA